MGVEITDAASRPTTAMSDGAQRRSVLGGVGEALRRRFWIMMLVAAAVFGGIAVWTLTADKRYTASLSVYFDPRDQGVSAAGGTGGARETTGALMESEARIIESRATAERVVRQLMLTNDPEFNPAVRQTGPLTDPDEAVVRRTANRLRQAIEAERARGTYVIDLAVTTTDPAKSQAIANSVADAYLAGQVEAKFAAADEAIRWIEARVEQSRARAEADAAALAAFRAEAGLTGTDDDVLLSPSARSRLDAELSEARAQLAAVRARLSAARRAQTAGTGGEGVVGVSSPLISELRLRLAELSARESDFRQSLGYTGENPQIVALAAERQRIAAEIGAEVDRLIAALDAEASALSAEIDALETRLAESRAAMSGNAGMLARMSELERRAEASRVRHETFLQRLETLSEEGGRAEPDARIVAYADLPVEASAPRTQAQLAWGALAALGAALLVAALLEWLDPTLKSVAGAERAAGARTLALMPRIRPGDRPKHLRRGSLSQIIVEEPRGGLAEVFRSMRASLRHPAATASGKSIAVVSALEGEGKTTITIGLGRSAALAGRRVLVIDADLRRASLTKEIEEGMQSFADPLGLADILRETVEPKKAIRRDPMTALDYIPSFGWAADSVDGMFETAQFKALLNRLSADYDEIYVDTPPVFAVTDARDIARATDTTIFVVRFQQGRREAVANIGASFRAGGLRLAGLVLNMVPPSTIRRHRFDVNNPYGYYGFHSTAYSSAPTAPPPPPTPHRPDGGEDAVRTAAQAPA